MDISRHLIPVLDEFEPSSAHDIDRLTAAVGVQLPSDYLAFLQSYGRCMINGEADVLGHGLATFFGTRSDAGNVISDYLSHDDYVARKLVPIGDDFFNNRYVLNLSTAEVGFIQYSSGSARYSVIARSFSDFIDVVSVAPDPDGA